MPIDTPGWVRDAVFYQVFPDRFARERPGPDAGGRSSPGTRRRPTTASRAATCSGRRATARAAPTWAITALYLTPIFASASNHRYHAYDYLEVDPLLGGDAALRELLDEAHARDMRVVLDGVFNHCGRGFWPFHHVRRTAHASPYRDWFHLDPARPRQAPVGLDAYRRRPRGRSAG